MPVLRSQRIPPSSTSLRRRGNPMNLGQILRGPGLSPSDRLNMIDSAFNDYFPASPNVAYTQTPLHKRAVASSASKTPRADENYNPQRSPNPFLVSPQTNPSTPRSSYPLFCDDGDWTSPFIDSPTSGGLHPRALRRHGAVALLVPQTPSTPRRSVASGGAPHAESVAVLVTSSEPTQHANMATTPTIKVEKESPESHSPDMAEKLSDHTGRELSTIRAFRLGDVEFLGFEPSTLPESESSLIMKLDSTGLRKAQFSELIAFCLVCHTYMTRRSIVHHKCCGKDHHPQNPSPEHESRTKSLLRLMTGGDPAGGLSEARFCSLFFKCPECFDFMTWDVARYHDCGFDAVKNWGASDWESDGY